MSSNKKMIVDQVSTTVFGGAGIAARRLHHALIDMGVDSRFWCKKRARSADLDESYAVPRWGRSDGVLAKTVDTAGAKIRGLRDGRKLKRALKGRPAGLEIFTSPLQGTATRYSPQEMQGDVIHLHWISMFLDVPSFLDGLPAEQPVVWTLHDMNTFTGGCHYSSDCLAYRDECRNCPQLGQSAEGDMASHYFQIKQKAIQGKNLHIVTPSNWMEREARSSTILQHAKSFQTIHNGLDTELFRPYGKEEAREKLGVPQEGVIVGFGSQSLATRRKGAQILLNALALLPEGQEVVCLSFGGGTVGEAAPGTPRVISMGYVNDPVRQALLYSATDVFVMPSLEDNLPQTGVEAMACGTPVVAFDTGGVPDYVRPGQTGLLAAVGDPEDLARKISWLVEHPQERAQMAANARELILRDFHHESQAQKYLEAYQGILGGHECSADGQAA